MAQLTSISLNPSIAIGTHMVALPLPELPDEIADLRDLALDLRWTWSHEGDSLWECIDERLWQRTRNPWLILQSASAQKLERLAADRVFCDKLAQISTTRKQYLERPGWFAEIHGDKTFGGVAYLSMEYGLGTA